MKVRIVGLSKLKGYERRSAKSLPVEKSVEKPVLTTTRWLWESPTVILFALHLKNEVAIEWSACRRTIVLLLCLMKFNEVAMSIGDNTGKSC